MVAGRHLAWQELDLLPMPTCRRLHAEAMPTGALEPPEEAMAGEQAAHEAETASLALAVLVRLTAHAGEHPGHMARRIQVSSDMSADSYRHLWTISRS